MDESDKADMIVMCSFCGEENRSEARFCRYCGQPLVSPESAEQSPASEGRSEKTTENLPAASDSLAPGRLLQGRYRIKRLVEEGESNFVYEAEDLLRCWNCLLVQAQTETHYCENCGADLTQKPLLRLVASPASHDAVNEVDETRFIEEGVSYLVDLADVITETAPPPIQLRMTYGFQSDPGKVRDNNEDSLVTLQLAGVCDQECHPMLGLFAVADGVGGAASGEIASQAVVRSLAQSAMLRIFTPTIAGESVAEDDLAKFFREMILSANQVILDLRSQVDDNDMGCTVTAVLVQGPQAVIANVGDSRIYRLRQTSLEQITQDHSVVARLVEQGLVQPEELYTHFQRSIIYRSLGSRSDLDVDIFPLTLEAGDRLLLCSDGLWEMVRDPMLEENLLERNNPQLTCNRLVELANLAGGEDNISVILLDIDAQF